MATALTQISGYAHVAAVYGFEEAVFLDSIIFWYRTNKADNRNFRNGRWWTYNSIKAFEEVFPWWSAKQIRRIAASCREQGALISGEFNKDRRDRSLWYTPSDALLTLYGLSAETGTCTGPDRQMVPETDPDGQVQSPKRADELAQMGECNIRNTCSNHVETDMTPYSPPDGQSLPDQTKDVPPGSPADCPPPEGASTPPASDSADKPAPKRRKRRQDRSAPAYNPEAFETFWAAYPRKDNRKKAADAWDKLRPDQELCRRMYTALKKQCRSAQWAEEDGRYIPMFSTWLNQRRWENQGVDLSLIHAPKPSNSDGWADDSEVRR